MVRTCIVRDCYTAKTNENIAIFSVPKDPLLFDAWKSNLLDIKRPLSVSSYVCEKHFHPSDVGAHYIHKLPSQTWSYSYGRKRLKAKAVPLFSNICKTTDTDNILHNYREPMESNTDVPIETNDDVPDETNDDVPIKTNDDIPIEIDDDVPVETNDDVPIETNDNVLIKTDNNVLIETDDDVSLETNNFDIDSNFDLSIKSSLNTIHVSTQTVLNMVDVSTQTVSHDDKDNEQQNNCEVSFTFDTLLMNLNNLKYPGNCNWAYIIAPDKKTVIFLSISTDNILRRVEIYDNLKSRVLIEFIQVHEDYVHHNFKNINEVIDYLTTIHNWNICITLKNSERFISNTVCEAIASCNRQNLGRPTLRCMSCNINIEAQKWASPINKVKKVLENKILQQKVTVDN